MNAAKLRKTLNRQKGECTWCGKPVGPGRRTWCGPECVEAFKLEHDWQYIRRRVYERDHGVCAECGVDCERIRSLVSNLRYQDGWEPYRHLAEFYRSLGWHDVITMDLWQADHIVPRVRGGGNELSNLRTLCIPCHKADTKALRAELAAERQRERMSGRAGG